MSKINDYARFVDQCTSETSKDTSKMCDRLDYLRGNYSMKSGEVIEQEVDMARLMTALIGMMAESGEFAEVVNRSKHETYQSTAAEEEELCRALAQSEADANKSSKADNDDDIDEEECWNPMMQFCADAIRSTKQPNKNFFC